MTRFLLLLTLALLLPACHGRTRYQLPRAAPTRAPSPAPAPAPTPTWGRPVAGPPSPPPSSRGVFLSDRDLAPVDAFISARNAQWILADDVEVVASREYFAQNLTVNATLGTVQRRDSPSADQTVVELLYLGAPGTASVTTSPRVLIGTGLTITARRRLVVRLVKTKNAAVPLRLRISARGKATRGRREEILTRAPSLMLGGEIRRQGNRWVWYPIG